MGDCIEYVCLHIRKYVKVYCFFIFAQNKRAFSFSKTNAQFSKCELIFSVDPHKTR